MIFTWNYNDELGNTVMLQYSAIDVMFQELICKVISADTTYNTALHMSHPASIHNIINNAKRCIAASLCQYCGGL
ncbi:hypothetical protein CASFOL_021089 [Castilleja foliolosa]|uniref:Uncharacterized protein n=1 Tax=Castilleja foliolosa TaxID=1961234 RepID=A0ABD3CVI8_9LAMI